jgi:formate-dependent phosphoribosylglycinamide formyltransferase (GAR transformylase)
MQSTESQVFFSEVGGSTYAHKLVVSSSISVSALTAQVAAVLGKPSDEIKLYATAVQ